MWSERWQLERTSLGPLGRPEASILKGLECCCRPCSPHTAEEKDLEFRSKTINIREGVCSSRVSNRTASQREPMLGLLGGMISLLSDVFGGQSVLGKSLPLSLSTVWPMRSPNCISLALPSTPLPHQPSIFKVSQNPRTHWGKSGVLTRL